MLPVLLGIVCLTSLGAGSAGRVVPRGWTLYLKGGWGSGSGRMDHQVALLRRGTRRVAGLATR